MLLGQKLLGFPCNSVGKESACNVGDPGSIPGLGRFPGEGKATHSRILENSMDCMVHGVTKSRTWLSDFHFDSYHWDRMKMLLCKVSHPLFECQLNSSINSIFSWKEMLESSFPIVSWLMCHCAVCCAMLSHSDMSVSLRSHGLHVVHQAPLSMRMLQARTLEWVAMPSSRGSSQPGDGLQVSRIAGRLFTIWAIHSRWIRDAPFLIRVVFGNQSIAVLLLLFSSSACPTLCHPMDCSTSGLPVPHYLLEFAEVHIHWIGDAIQPSHPLLPSSPSAFNLPHHQGFLKWVDSSHQVTKVLELHLQHQPRYQSLYK